MPEFRCTLTTPDGSRRFEACGDSPEKARAAAIKLSERSDAKGPFVEDMIKLMKTQPRFS